ncbi:MAG: peptidylprolyl isomerase [Planctomycetota bacterium]
MNSLRSIVLATSAVVIVGCSSPEVVVPPMPDERFLDFDDDADVRTIDEVGDDPIQTPLTPTGSQTPGRVEAPPVERPEESEPPQLEYVTVDGVLGEFNGRAVYAADVINARKNQLRARALRLPRNQFGAEAFRIIQEELQVRMRNKLYLSVYERNLNPLERQQAKFLTMLWRERFITENGGSEAEARRASRDQFGMTLEQLGEDEYGRRLNDIFMQKHIAPRVRPAAAELREAYEDRREKGEFDVPGGIVFALIEIAAESADPIAIEAAKARAEALHERALAGEDFGELARNNSDNADYASRGGLPPDWMLPIARGAFAIPQVAEAAWEAEVDTVAPLVAVGEGEARRWYVIQVREKETPRTMTFAEVQRRLNNELALAEQNRLVDDYIRRELGRAKVPELAAQRLMTQTAMEVVMQQYDAWRAEEAAASAR